MQRLILSIFFYSILCLYTFAQAPADYYITAEGKTGLELKAALHNKIKGHTMKTYDQAWDILKETDRDPNNPANVILFYTGWSVNAAQEYNNGTGWNREHVWAKSHGDFGTSNGPGSDCHHLRPCDISVNEKRGNMYFDYADVLYTDPSGPTGCKYNTTRDVWEPRDVEKGDVARIIFYMATRYEGEDGFPDLEVVDYIPTNDAAPLFGDLSTLIEWNALDPVDAFEMNRNNVVFSYQKNRNPFIDHPEYVEMIWGPAPHVNTAPVISNISFSPSIVFPADEVLISAEATDEDGTVDSVKIYWGTSANSLQDSIKMNLSAGKYITSIGTQTKGTTVYFKIAAWDNEHAKTLSLIQSYTVQSVNELPVLSDVSYSPLLPSSSDKVEVTVSASDPDGTLTSVNLYWGLKADEFTNAMEMKLTDGKYSASIPAQLAGTGVFFKVIAWDNLDSMRISDVMNFIVDVESAILKTENVQVLIYPNPSSGLVYINHKLNESVFLYSVDGKKLMSTSECSLDISSLKKGFYLIQIVDENNFRLGYSGLIKE